MRAYASLFALILFAGPLSVFAQGAQQLAQSLLNAKEYLRDVVFEVLPPSVEDPIVYDVTLQSSRPEVADSLSPCDYVIRWETMSPSGLLKGFSAYFDGHHYRYRNNRLQEYHLDVSPSPFLPQGAGSEQKGVQCNAQFCDVLPQFLGMKMMEIVADSAYEYRYHPDTLVSGVRRQVVEGVKRSAGYDVVRFTYVFDKDTSLPVYIDLENSPGSISEQLVTVKYANGSKSQPVTLSEEGLIEQWPDVFEKFRENTFRAESLIGSDLPTFSCQIAGSTERFTHHRGEALNAATIIVAIDPAVSSIQSTVDAVRSAVDTLPMPVDVLWASKSNKEDDVLESLGDLRQEETALVSAGSLMRNVGIGLFPTIIICSADGKVKDVIAGFNNGLDEVVIQKMTLGL